MKEGTKKNNLNSDNMEQKELDNDFKNPEKDKKKLIYGGIAVGIIIIVIISLSLWKKSKKNTVETDSTKSNISSDSSGSVNGEMQMQSPINPEDASYLSGLSCPGNNKRRAIAVMQAADISTRPLSGLSEADMVFEMPCITASITRLMGVYVCNAPKEIGSIRSSRHDYITLAKGIDAIYGHWGGSHFALEILKNKNTVPDLDAMANPHGAFFRKEGIEAPDNGFASYEGLENAAEILGYRMENHFEGYPHQTEATPDKRPKGGNLRVGFAKPFDASYTYDPKTNSYLRTWGNKEDTDRTTGKRIAPKNIIVMFANSRQIEGQYNDVDVEGTGEMHAYFNGQEIVGKWIKEKKNCIVGNDLVCMTDSKLKFSDESGQEIKFIPGQIWVEILEPGQKLKWEPIN